MAFGRLERAGKQQPMSEINMTPLIDVMLVLLVVFMLTAPLMTSGLKLDLPEAEGGPVDPPDASVLSVAIAADGQLYWGEQKVSRPDLEVLATSAGKRGGDREVQLRAEKAVPYGNVAELLAVLQKAGLSRIAFVTEAPSDPAAAAQPGTAASH
ncbi:MAG: biopolymer transporter ExbD [Aquabacterium sp.]|nr:MAG: biopolymer transporter ExbD [Aquabacterium sp.]